MKYFLLFTLLILPSFAHAQEVTPHDIPFKIRNEAPYKIFGEVATPYYINTENGQNRRNVATFVLEAVGGKDTIIFNSSGPFFPDRQLEITLRGLFPIFSCKTSIELGDIVIKGRLNDDGTSKTWIECL